ncbi:MAG: hypothetical protein ABJH26_07325 [Marinomonas sp.]
MSRFGSSFTPRILAASALAIALQGCVAAALPVLAGGAIVGTEANRNKSKTADDAAENAETSEAVIAEAAELPEAKAAPKPKSENPQDDEDANLSMAELARRDIQQAQSTSDAELPAKGSETAPKDGTDPVTETVAEAATETATGNVEIDPARFAPMSVYVLEALAKEAPAQGRMSAILANPSSLKPVRLPCGRSQLAVLIDLDPKGGLHDPAAIAPTYDGDVLGHVSRLRDAGVKIGWISALTAADAGSVRKALRVSGLDVKGEDELVLLRYPGDRKQTRRAEFGVANCLIALAGDERADFDELYDYLLRPSSAVTLEPMIGQGWFLLPALQ